MTTVPDTRPDPPPSFDTVGIAVPCDDFDRVGCEVSIAGFQTPDETFKYSRRLPGGGFVATGIAGKAWLEASLPKRATPDDPDNSVAVPLIHALELLSDMVGEARQWVDIPAGHDFYDSKLVRLDLVRDFHGVDRQTELLDGLAGIRQPGRAKVRRFADPSANRAETLRVGPKAWGCALYDKHTETAGKAPAGQMRFEARLHRPQLASVFARHNGGNFATVADLARSDGYSVIRHGVLIQVDGNDGGRSLARAQRAWFDRVGFDRPVRSGSALRSRIASAGLSNRVAGNLWAFLTFPGFANSLSINTHGKYRSLAADLGLTPPADGETIDPSEGEIMRLDYETASFVCERAAA